MKTDIQLEISDADIQIGRLDRILLAHFPESSRSLVADAFERGNVARRGKVLKKSDKPQLGDIIQIRALAESGDRAVVPSVDPNLAIAFCDADLVAIDKEAGQPCHPATIAEAGTLASAILARFPEVDGIGDNPLMPGMLHRIDAGTSGLILVARNAMAFENVRRQFTEHSAVKVYLAEVEGDVAQSGGVCGLLAHSDSFRGRMRCVASKNLPKGERAMKAETFYEPLRRGGGCTLLKVTIRTGVTHQIRCQLAFIGHPIVGDTIYGATSMLMNSRGQYHCLHALSATIEHPTTHKSLTLCVPYPNWAK